MRRTLFPLTCLALLAGGILSAAPARGDILWFKNGRSLEGKVRELPDGQVEIALSFGTLAFSKDQVARVERARTLEEIVHQALRTLDPQDTEGLYELAAWCEEKEDHTLAKRLYRQVLELDPDHAGARRALGFRRYEGSWLQPEEFHAARDEVLYRGRWVPRRQLERALAEEEEWRRQRRSELLEEARLELEISRLELEAEQAREDETEGLPYYVYPFGFSAPPPHQDKHGKQGRHGKHRDGISQGEGSQQQRADSAGASERRRHGTPPRHTRGGFKAPQRP